MKDVGEGAIINDFEGKEEEKIKRGKREKEKAPVREKASGKSVKAASVLAATVAMAAKQKKREGERESKKGKEQVNGKNFLKITLYIEAVASYFPSTLKLPINPLTQQFKFHNLIQMMKLTNSTYFLNFYPSITYFEINYDKLAEKIIRFSYVKSKDQLADFLFKSIDSKALKDIFCKFGIGDPKTKLEGSVGK